MGSALGIERHVGAPQKRATSESPTLTVTPK